MKYKYFERSIVLPSPSGSKWQKVHRLVRNGNNLSLEETGVLNTQELIQSYEDGVSLEKMIQRFRRGDEQALNRKQAFYADVSGMPTDLGEVMRNGREAVQLMTELAEKSGDDSNSSASDQSNSNSEVNDNAEES